MPEPFPLPPHTLEPELERQLEPLCIDLPPERIAELRQQIAAHVALVLEATQYNERLDLTVARQIARVLTDLLQEHASYPPAHRRLIVGAARYFVRSRDVQFDLTTRSGFDDDITVLDCVLTEIGKSELRIDL